MRRRGRKGGVKKKRDGALNFALPKRENKVQTVMRVGSAFFHELMYQFGSNVENWRDICGPAHKKWAVAESSHVPYSSLHWICIANIRQVTYVDSNHILWNPLKSCAT